MNPDTFDIAYSTIIPTSNHPELLTRCLLALCKVNPPAKEWEVLVIDNSEERFKTANAQVVASFQESRFRYVTMPPLGLMAARHKGVEMARGHIVSFIDDDSFVSETWLEGIEQSFLDPNIVMVGGPNLPEYEITQPRWLDYFWNYNEYGRYMGYLSLLDFGDTMRDIDPTFVWGCNFSIRKDIFQRVGGSHPDYLPPQWKCFQGDGEVALSVKVASLGCKARYCPQCVIRHLVPESRMTFEYFGARAFFVGLHSSFTQIRRKHGLGTAQGVPLLPGSTQNSFYRLLRRWGGRVKRRFLLPSSFFHREPEDVIRIRRHLQKCYADGWNFHQREVNSNPALLEYVLRPNYMGENARLP